MNKAAAFDVIRLAAENAAIAEEIVNNPGQVLKDHGVSEPQMQAEIERIVAALKSAVTESPSSKQQASTLETAESFKSGLRNTVVQIERGFRSTMIMYEVAFYLGVGLILAAILMAFVKEQSLLAIAFGSLGIIDIIVYFITKPPQDLQFSRARLAQLEAAFFNWFIDYTSWNGAMMNLAQQGRLDFNAMTKISNTLMEHTEKTMELIDKYCGAPKKGTTYGERTLGHVLGNRSQRPGRTHPRSTNLRPTSDSGASDAN